MTTYYKAVKPDGTDFRTGRVLYAVGETVTHPKPHKRDASGYLSVAVLPTDCTGSSWPLRLFEVTADEVWKDSGYPNKRCTHSLTVVRELDPMLALGPQGPALVALFERCKHLTADEVRSLRAAWDAAWPAARDAAWPAARAAAWAAAWDAARAAARAAAWAAARPAAWPAARDAAWPAARDAAWEAAWEAARPAARDAAWEAAWEAARDAAWEAARDAARAAVVRDLIGQHGFTQEMYDTLTGPWRKVIGPVHPDDVDLRTVTALSQPLEFEKQLRDVARLDAGWVFDTLLDEVGIDPLEEFCAESRPTSLEEHLWAVRASAAAQRVKYVAGEDA